MEFQRRRGRRSKHRSYQSISQAPPRQTYFTNSLISFLILSSLIGIIYMMLDQHCNNCKSKPNIGNLTAAIALIEKNITELKHSYQDLELKILNFSHTLPKMEGQIEIIEALANTIGGKQCIRIPKSHFTVPHVDDFEKPMATNEKLINKPCAQRTLKPIVNIPYIDMH